MKVYQARNMGKVNHKGISVTLLSAQLLEKFKANVSRIYPAWHLEFLTHVKIEKHQIQVFQGKVPNKKRISYFLVALPLILNTEKGCIS